jgi:hypothetical protein
MPSDDNARPLEKQCPVCRGPMRVVRVESGVPGLPPDLRRQMIKCSACNLVAVAQSRQMQRKCLRGSSYLTQAKLFLASPPPTGRDHYRFHFLFLFSQLFRVLLVIAWG